MVRPFALDLDATQIAELAGLNRNTVNRYLRGIRERVADYCDASAPMAGEIEVDEPCFGAPRSRGKRGRGAFGKTAVLGLFKRNGCVCTEIVPNVSRATLQGIMRGRVRLDSVIYSDRRAGYNGQVDVGYGKLYRVASDGEQGQTPSWIAGASGRCGSGSGAGCRNARTAPPRTTVTSPRPCRPLRAPVQRGPPPPTSPAPRPWRPSRCSHR